MEHEKSIKSTLWAKGSGATGCLLASDLEDSAKFRPLELKFEVLQLDLSGSFVLAISKEHQLFLWGQLDTEIIKQPVLLGCNVMKISCGWNHALFECGGQLWGLGVNSNCQLGVSTADKFIKKPIMIRQDKVDHFICGFRQSYLICKDTLLGCGESRKYELGLSEKKPLLWREIFTTLHEKISSKIVELKIGKRFLLMRTENKQIWAVGFNEQNSFNSKEVPHLIVPTLIFDQVQKIACGWAHIVMLDNQGSIKTYGRNNLDQLGRKEGSVVKIGLKEGQQVRDIVCGTQFSFVVTTMDRVFGWGWNEHRNILQRNAWSLPQPQQINTGPCSRLWTHPAITITQRMFV